MQRPYDTVIRGGTLADGSGGGLREADVALKDGRVAAVGAVSGAGTEEIDAKGLLVTPGFVDIHTHYDGQATWENRLQPSSLHGVTTVVFGNCGVGFAPCRPSDHDRLIELMEGVEDIPFPVLAEGLPWNWESFPDYLDALAARKFDVDIGAQAPHAAIRVFVMGERGVKREPATAQDIAAMAALAREAVEAGALGFTTSRTPAHRTVAGEPTPTLTASEDELQGIAQALNQAGRGVLQVVTDFADAENDFALLRRLAIGSGRPLSFQLAQSPRRPDDWRMLLGALEDANAAGARMKAQVAGRSVGLLFGLELSLNPFSEFETYKQIAHLPLAARAAALRDPALRARLFAERPEIPRLSARARNWAFLFPILDDPDYEPPPEKSVAAMAARRGVSPDELALDMLLENGGRGMLQMAFLNYAEGSLAPSYEMLQHKDAIMGLSDGGAHVGIICDGSFPTSNLTLWTRDRTRGPKLPIEKIVQMQTSATAEALGLRDRGRIAPGYRADVNVIDYDRLRLRAPEVIYDLPCGGRRLMQRADGYRATMVGGEITYRDGAHTGALPGRLVRGAQPSPTA